VFLREKKSPSHLELCQTFGKKNSRLRGRKKGNSRRKSLLSRFRKKKKRGFVTAKTARRRAGRREEEERRGKRGGWGLANNLATRIFTIGEKKVATTSSAGMPGVGGLGGGGKGIYWGRGDGLSFVRDEVSSKASAKEKGSGKQILSLTKRGRGSFFIMKLSPARTSFRGIRGKEKRGKREAPTMVEAFTHERFRQTLYHLPQRSLQGVSTREESRGEEMKLLPFSPSDVKQHVEHARTGGGDIKNGEWR